MIVTFIGKGFGLLEGKSPIVRTFAQWRRLYHYRRWGMQGKA